MTDAASSPQLESAVDAQLIEYRSVSVLAVFALLLGLCAPLAMLGPVLWIVPALGVAVSVWALLAIAKSEGALVGRKAALTGLSLALVCGAAAASARVSEGWWLRGEARPVAARWFELLRDDQPLAAHQLTLTPGERATDASALESGYRDEENLRQSLERFVHNPLIRALLALGGKAEVRYYATESHHRDGDQQRISQIYAITYPDDGRRVTFFGRLVLFRSLDRAAGKIHWQVLDYKGGIRPFAWSEQG
jgi:hypothetical protein